MFVIDLLLLAHSPVILPDPGMHRVFMHAQVTRRLRNRLFRLDCQFNCTLLKVGGNTFSSWLGSSNTPRRLREFRVSVCPEEYSHITLPISTNSTPKTVVALSWAKTWS